MSAQTFSATCSRRPTPARAARCLCPLAGLWLLLALVGDAGAESAQATFQVRALVVPNVALEVLEQPSSLEVTAADVARGYKDARAKYRATQHAGRGWLLSLAPRVGLAARVEVRGLRQMLVVESDTVFVHFADASGPTQLDLAFRFVLAPQAKPGSYPLPIYLFAVPE